MVRSLLAYLTLSACLVAGDKQPEISKISEAFGHLIGKNLKAIGVDLDLDLVAKGLQDDARGEDSPLSESECIAQLAAFQEELYQKKAGKNLEAAEAFLKQNAKQKHVVSLAKGKVQYTIDREGAGNAVEEKSSPAIKYVGRYLDGSVFGRSDQEQVIPLEETIGGFTQGLVGMKEGEQRTLYIHPDCGYGTSGDLEPNSLLTFEIELIKANVEKEAPSDALILDSPLEAKVADSLDAPQVR